MKRVIFTTTLIFTFCLAVFAQTKTQELPIVDPNVIPKMSWKDEKLRLDDFAKRINQSEDKIGFITLQFDKKTTRNQVKTRLNRISSYLFNVKKIEKTRLNLVISGFRESEGTMYWIVDKTDLSKK